MVGSHEVRVMRIAGLEPTISYSQKVVVLTAGEP